MLARQAAYSLLYALPAIVDRYTHSHLATTLQREIDKRAPEELKPLLDSLVQHAVAEQSGTAAAEDAVIALAITLWGGASGTGALIYACNRVFDVSDKRSFVRRKLLTLAGGSLVIAAFIFVVRGERVR